MGTVTVRWEMEHEVDLWLPEGGHRRIKQGDSFEMGADEARDRAATGQVSIVEGKAKKSAES